MGLQTRKTNHESTYVAIFTSKPLESFEDTINELISGLGRMQNETLEIDESYGREGEQ